MTYQAISKWLLQGDVSIQYQVYRDLLSQDRKDLQKRIETEGWGKAFIETRKSDGHWGQRFYQPKWISSHYTLLDLRNLCISPNNKLIRESIDRIFREEKGPDGGINPSPVPQSDLCINGMFLNYASYFKTDQVNLRSIVDFILSQQLPDGGFNCRFNRSGAVHSSMHSTISTMEGIIEYEKNNYGYRLKELKKAAELSKEFLLMHQLFLSDRTGKIIHKDFLKLSYPSRWKYDILRALDYFQYAGVKWDERMQPAIDILHQKRRKDNRWNVQAKHPGKVHFEMEKAGQASRWNTLRVLRVFKHFGIDKKVI